MVKNFKSLILLSIAVPSLALAQTKEIKATATTEKPVDEADQVITNRRLRADSGSLSKWSASMYFNYQGGSVADPIKRERPNIVSGADALVLQNFVGEVGVRYRLSALDSLTASTGMFVSTPFHYHQKLTVSDPALKYTHLDKIWGVQSVSTIKPTLITNSQQKALGYEASYLFSQTFMKEVGETGFSYGAGIQALFYTFNNDNQNLSSSVSGIYPAAEYEINDTFNLRTVFGFQVYEQLRKQDSSTFIKRKVYQSVGLGISVSRDVFLYPNIQYIPSDIRSDRTNIAISANINMF